MSVGRSLVKLTIGGGCVLGGVAFPPLLAGEGIVLGTVLATTLGSVAAGNTANALDALFDGREGGVSLENQDLTKAVGKAIAAVITLAAKSQRGKTRQYLEKIAAQAKDNWVKIAQQELTQQRYPELREAKLDQFLTPEEYQLTQQGNLTATEWGDIFIRLNMAACKGGGFPIPAEVRQQVAELLHTTFPKALRETLKEDFAQDGKAFAGLTLQLLTGMQAQLRQLQASQGEVNVGEFSQILQQFQEVETQLRGSVTQQQAFFTEISGRIDSGFAEVCHQLGVMETTITELLQTLEERLEELRQEVTEFRQEVRQGFESLHNQPGGRPFSKQEYRNRQNILTQMRTEVESRLTQSIHRAAFVNLGKEQQPQQVQRPWDMSVKVGEQRSVQLPPQTTILDVFENPTISGKFLILGKPGGGKTTTLLELAEALIERAEGDSDTPIPVILELSSWQEVTKRKFLSFGEGEKYDPSIKEWVLSQLISKGVSQDIGEQWLREKELVLLLDGLDELQPERQAKCVRAINQFLGSEFSPLHLVVCSRKEEYEVYEEMLHLNGAICLEDLTNEQIRDYFTSVNLGEFWKSIKSSEKIVNFIRQPLFLAVTSLAYEQIDVEEWRNCNTEERAIDYLLGVYRISIIKSKKDKETISFQNKVIWISRLFLDQGTELDVHKIQPSKLSKNHWKTYCKTTGFLYTFAICTICLITFKLSTDYFLSTVIHYILTFIFPWIFFGIFLGMNILPLKKIKDYCLRTHTITFLVFYFPSLMLSVLWSMHEYGGASLSSWSSIGNGLKSDSTLIVMYLAFGIGLSVFSMLGWGLENITIQRIFEPPIKPKDFDFGLLLCQLFYVNLPLGYAWGYAWEYFLVNLCIWASLGISIYVWESEGYLCENAKIRYTHIKKSQIGESWFSSSRNTIFFIKLGVTLFSCFLLGLLMSVYQDHFVSLSNVIILILLIILPVILTLFQYLSLRLTLLTLSFPMNLVPFFDDCTKKLILQRVGDRYRFIHRLVQEHFANLEIQKE